MHQRDGSGGACAVATGFDSAGPSVVSPDGRHVYVVTKGVLVFDRDAGSGRLTQLASPDGCHTPDGTAGACRVVRSLDVSAGRGIAISPDGMNVYVGGGSDGGFAIFDRDSVTGALTQKAGTAGCINDSGADGCGTKPSAGSVIDLAVSADGNQVYAAVTSPTNGVMVFDRNAGTGALTVKAGADGCVSDTGNAPCATGTALDGPHTIVVSPDGANVYLGMGLAGGSDSVAIFDRDGSGVLTQKAIPDGCWSDTGNGGDCQDARGLFSVFGLAISPGGGNVYAALNDDHGVAIFDRDAGTGALTQKSGVFGCINEQGGAEGCDVGQPYRDAWEIATSPDGANVYMGVYSDDAVVVFDVLGVDCEVTTTTTTTSTTTTSTTTTTTLGGACGPLPAGDCFGAAHHGGVLQVRSSTQVKRRRLKWQFRSSTRGGDLISRSDFGDPVGDTPDYTLCVYSGILDLSLIHESSISGGGGCNGKPCWRATDEGYRYKDGAGSSDGYRKGRFEVSDDGSTRMELRAKGGPSLSLPILGEQNVISQLIVDDGAGPRCWQIDHSRVLVNNGRAFVGTGP